MPKISTKQTMGNNCQVVSNLNKLIRSGKLHNQGLAKRLRDSTIRLQGTPLVESGLPYLAAVHFVQNNLHILNSLSWDF